MKELIVNSMLCFIDVALVTVGLIMIFGTEILESLRLQA